MRCKEENALFSGDHIMGWSTTVISPPDGNMGDYYRSLDKIRARGFETLWPTHGPPVTDVTPFIDAYVAHRRAREEAIVARMKAGDTLIPEMVKVIYKDVDERLHAPAAHSVLAHMIHLVEAGRVIADGPLTLATRYRLAACMIYLVRHGQTAFNAEGRIQGAKDSPLTALGVEQGKRSGDRWRMSCRRTRGSSHRPLGRTQHTARLIREAWRVLRRDRDGCAACRDQPWRVGRHAAGRHSPMHRADFDAGRAALELVLRGAGRRTAMKD